MKRSQFSISYLMLEVLWISLGLGLTLGFLQQIDSHYSELLFLGAFVSWSISAGGLFHRMRFAAIVALVLMALLFVTFGEMEELVSMTGSFIPNGFPHDAAN